ncbi:hypothetical protein BCR41DRAFT_389021 [Lobosporangium transversale]|uniref:Swiss Army Knife 2H phosphoesterase domain-containing protein n=1 Tax=Lobosporangium transversale TaxID=64571 RepID=A0A1Y2GCE5_9FUNG|nr:hypothetical protein BCR41DRAFT_391007 [Lobosporangium transversale]XP_021877784.1 hypothetical protein BCR41DRAFT_389021 [Lobosporangium transversale]ORY89513.1 hypothetical protein BCR41DRAFT_391007 [Lobosporangium transversale]ORZ06988.1 hypothetical protein BCR41DRAFT_389021 [Lobosporangium transversale]|eukprot:XP_021875054.1 hypothetical protein BCR41DRAFT_391007 [Lobosporangium transversale]
MRVATFLFATLALVASTVMAGPKTVDGNKKYHSKPIVINKKVFQTSKVPFIPHSGTGLFANWVGLNVDFKYVKPVFDLVNTTKDFGNGTLISRGESHITVILPTEYDQILHPAGVTIEEINALASHKNRLQRSRHRDIHAEDGVFKGKNACIHKIVSKPLSLSFRL